MAAPTTCPSCGADVPADRLTCPSCGAVLASVSGGGVLEPSRRQGGPAVEHGPGMPAWPSLSPEGESVASPPAPAQPVAAEPVASESVASEPVGPGASEPVAPVAPPAPSTGAAQQPLGPDEPLDAAEGEEAAAAPHYIERPLIHDPLAPTPPTPRYAPRPPRPALEPQAGEQWFSTRHAGDHEEPGPAEKPVTPGRVGFLSDLPFDAPDSIPAWLSAIGPSLLALAFLLPWGNVPGLGWFDTWGLRDLRYFAAFLVALGAAVAALIPSRLPPRVRFGYLPLLVGAAGLGLFLDVPVADPAIGVWALALGGLTATVGGLWMLMAGDRRAGTH